MNPAVTRDTPAAAVSRARVGGAVLVGTSLGFIAVFSYLAASFGYPEVLDGEAATVLPALLAGGSAMRAAWAFYAALPVGIGVAATQLFPLLRGAGEQRARIGLVAAWVATLAMITGLARWPTLHHGLAVRFATAGSEERRQISALFDGANLYLGNVTGEFIGEIALCVWFTTLGLASLRGVGAHRSVGYLGLATAFSMTIGAFRNVTGAVAVVAEVNNTLLPLWLIAFGVALWVRKAPSARR